jgi:hypothetical protein
VNTIIDYLTQNGVMSPAQLAKPPFSGQHFEGVFGLFEDASVMELRNKIKNLLHFPFFVYGLLSFALRPWPTRWIAIYAGAWLDKLA